MEQLALFDKSGPIEKASDKVKDPNFDSNFELDRFTKDFTLKLGTGTLKIYKHYLKRYFDWLSSEGISPISAKSPDIKWFLSDMVQERRGRAPANAIDNDHPSAPWTEKSREVALSAIRRFYDWACHPDQRLCQSNPAMNVPFPSVAQRVPTIVKERYYEFIKAKESDNALNSCLIMLFAEAGLKTAEVVELDLENIAFQKGGVAAVSVIKPQSKRSQDNEAKGQRHTARTLKLNSDFIVQFQKLLLQKQIDWTIPDNSKFQPFKLHPKYGAQAINRIMEALNSKYGLREQELMPKNLRHYFHRTLLDSGVSNDKISELLGLAPYDVTTAAFNWEEFKRVPR